jgi:NADH-quinone oxidoreductase subunit J
MMLNLNAKDESKNTILKFVGIISAGILFVGMIGAYKGLKTNVVQKCRCKCWVNQKLRKIIV